MATGRGDAAAATWRFWVAATPRPRRGDSEEAGRGDAAAATWRFRGDESPPRPRREYSAETSRRRGRDVEIPRRRVAATPRLRRVGQVSMPLGSAPPRCAPPWPSGRWTAAVRDRRGPDLTRPRRRPPQSSWRPCRRGTRRSPTPPSPRRPRAPRASQRYPRPRTRLSPPPTASGDASPRPAVLRPRPPRSTSARAAARRSSARVVSVSRASSPRVSRIRASGAAATASCRRRRPRRHRNNLLRSRPVVVSGGGTRFCLGSTRARRRCGRGRRLARRSRRRSLRRGAARSRPRAPPTSSGSAPVAAATRARGSTSSPARNIPAARGASSRAPPRFSRPPLARRASFADLDYCRGIARGWPGTRAAPVFPGSRASGSRSRTPRCRASWRSHRRRKRASPVFGASRPRPTPGNRSRGRGAAPARQSRRGPRRASRAPRPPRIEPTPRPRRRGPRRRRRPAVRTRGPPGSGGRRTPPRPRVSR